MSRRGLAGPASYVAGLFRIAFEVFVLLVVAALMTALLRQFAVAGSISAVMGHDNEYYLQIALQVTGGRLPYVDFAFEYPPLALPPIVLPVLAWPGGAPDAQAYAVILALENAILAIATAALLAWLARRGWSARGVARTVVVYGLLVFATPIFFFRFDAFPALVSVLAICLFAAGRHALSGVALSVASLVKLYPLALVPLFGLREVVRRDVRALARLMAGVGLPILTALALLTIGLGSAGLSFLTYQATRGVQLESMPASVGLLGYVLGGPAVSVFHDFGAWQLDSPLVEGLAWLWPALGAAMLAALAISAFARYRADRLEIGLVAPSTQVTHMLAALLLALLSYRVLSPQYLVWLLPLAALLPRSKVLLVLATCALTLYLYPFGYQALVDLQADSIVILALRNAMLAALYAWLVGPGIWLAIKRADLFRPARSPRRG